MPKNYEFKARTARLDELEALLKQHNPRFLGEDHQADTYFNVSVGRLKLREGNIENALIHYKRSDLAGAKTSEVLLYEHAPDLTLKQILTTALGIKVVVNKARRIYFIGNIKFHFDRVEGLGEFVEVEAIDRTDTVETEELKRQCAEYEELFQIPSEDYVAVSYSDLLLNRISV